MSVKSEKHGCGKRPATKVIFRGPKGRRFLCDVCPNKSSGYAAPYQTDTRGKEKPEGTYQGPERYCGEELDR